MEKRWYIANKCLISLKRPSDKISTFISGPKIYTATENHVLDIMGYKPEDRYHIKFIIKKDGKQTRVIDTVYIAPYYDDNNNPVFGRIEHKIPQTKGLCEKILKQLNVDHHFLDWQTLEQNKKSKASKVKPPKKEGDNVDRILGMF